MLVDRMGWTMADQKAPYLVAQRDEMKVGYSEEVLASSSQSANWKAAMMVALLVLLLEWQLAFLLVQ